MRSDFEPVHLKQANEKLDKILSSLKWPQEQEEEIVTKSLWKKFLDLFKRNPFELPEEFNK
ncbi:hypothetical protein [Sulfurovum sp. AR]|uniref:hypothetical protein n=1 Tax=Sulfurovum sp. AR TaxID=1165841 RepID=UPI00025C4F00|nr:hypothetical protein [Sulfurovum sp. AR]EIF51544.1 hypothetical protein SULAR_01723 [Sulfurovum sp. AR]